MLIYSLSKGAFAGQTLEGAVIEQDRDTTKAVYGSDLPFNKILLGQTAPPASAAPFLALSPGRKSSECRSRAQK